MITDFLWTLIRKSIVHVKCNYNCVRSVANCHGYLIIVTMVTVTVTYLSLVDNNSGLHEGDLVVMLAGLLLLMLLLLLRVLDFLLS